MEIWKDVIGYEWLYQVSNLWRLKSFNYRNSGKERVCNPSSLKRYVEVQLTKNWTRKHFMLHRLAGTEFVLNPDNKPFINHKDWNKHNNNIENLEWVTASENAIHKYRVLKHTPTNKWKFGRLHHNSKQVNQYDLEWNFIKEWWSIMEIERELWLRQQGVSSCCKWRAKTSWGFTWKFADTNK